MRVAEAKSPTGLPVSVTVYEPAGTLATRKEPTGEPPETLQLDRAPTAPPDSEQVESVAEKFVPFTPTVAPTEAEDELSERDGTIKEVCEDRVVVVVSFFDVEVVLTWSIDMEFGESRAAETSTVCCAALAPKFPTKDSTPTNTRIRMHSRRERCIQDSHISSHIRLNL